MFGKVLFANITETENETQRIQIRPWPFLACTICVPSVKMSEKCDYVEM